MRASFRGVPFFVVGLETCREKIFLHEKVPFASAESPPKIFGHGLTTYTIKGFVLGQNDADLLSLALAKDQAGMLIHPLLGVIDAMCVGYKVSASTDRLGRIDFACDFRAVPRPASNLAGFIVDPLAQAHAFVDEQRLLLAEHLAYFQAAEDGAARLKGLATKVTDAFGLAYESVRDSVNAATDLVQWLQGVPRALAETICGSKALAAPLASFFVQDMPSPGRRQQNDPEALLELSFGLCLLAQLAVAEDLSEDVRQDLLKICEAALEFESSSLPPETFMAVEKARAVVLARPGKATTTIPRRISELAARLALGRPVPRAKDLLFEPGEQL